MGSHGSEIAREVANTPFSEVLKRPEVVAARWAKFSSKLSDRVRQLTSHCDSIEEFLKLTTNGEIGKAAFAYRLIDDKQKAKQILSASNDLGWEDFRLKVNPTKYGDDPKPMKVAEPSRPAITFRVVSTGSSGLKKSDRRLLEAPKTSTFVEAKNQHTIQVLGTNVKQTTSAQARLMANLGTRTPLPASGVHEHTCDKCGSKYQHQHGGLYSQHAQNENQCPNPSCTWFHKGNNTTKAVPVGVTVEPKSATGQIPRRKDDTRSSTGSLYVEAEMQLHKRLREQISH